MKVINISIVLFTLLFLQSCGGPKNEIKKATTIHAVIDLAHEFSFYADGRFYTQYLPQQKRGYQLVQPSQS